MPKPQQTKRLRNPAPKAGGFAVLADPKGPIEAVLQVANRVVVGDRLIPVTDPDLVYDALDGFAYGGKVARLDEQGREAAAILSRDLVGPTGLIDKLCLIVKSPQRARTEYETSIDTAFQEKHVEFVAAPPRFTDGRVQASLLVRGHGAESMYTAALALLLDRTLRIDKGRTYGQALRRCALPSCNKFFLSFTGRSGGRPRDYDDINVCKPLHYKIQRAQKE